MSEYSFGTYSHLLTECLAKIDWNQIKYFQEELLLQYKNGAPVYVFGNGGSAAIADHFTCDHMKGINQDCAAEEKVLPRVFSLNTNISLITAIANDFDYSQIFSKQIKWLRAQSNTLITAISSSGNSENIIRGLDEAHIQGYKTAAIVGFDGGKVLERNLADIIIYIPSTNYGVVEDITQMIMHSIAQYIRTEYAHTGKIIKL